MIKLWGDMKEPPEGYEWYKSDFESLHGKDLNRVTYRMRPVCPTEVPSGCSGWKWKQERSGGARGPCYWHAKFKWPKVEADVSMRVSRVENWRTRKPEPVDPLMQAIIDIRLEEIEEMFGFKKGKS